MKKPAPEILNDLRRDSAVSVDSDRELVGKVDSAAAKEDAKRAAGGKAALRRKSGLRPITTAANHGSIHLTPWDALHALGRSLALSRQGAGRGLAEHWAALKYSQALIQGTDRYMTLSDEGHEATQQYKRIQSAELGTGFALALAEKILSDRYPDSVVSIVPADTALRAGWALKADEKGAKPSRYSYRPQFFAEVWKPGAPSIAIPIVCKGNHGRANSSHGQLATASVHVDGVHIGPWNETPCLVFSTGFPRNGPLTVYALHTTGAGGQLLHSPSSSLDDPLTDVHHYPGRRPTEPGEKLVDELGYHVTPEWYEWFRRVLARTNAAGLMAFAGAGALAAQYLTQRQGQSHFTGAVHAATDSVQDAKHTLSGIDFLGTDHVFRLNGTRVEAFSGVAEELFEHLRHGRVERYRRKAHAQRTRWPTTSFDPGWGGPVSFHPDGTVLAMRLL